MTRSVEQFKPAVEADSLSKLTTLASEPPLNPRYSDGNLQQPLVLYIARVPGSRDVFLTPLKPREKTVTAEDVESCLYYMHFEGLDDSNLVTTPDKPSVDSSDLHPLARPLPPTPIEQALDNPPALPPRPGEVASYARSSQTVRRKPLPDTSRLKEASHDSLDFSLGPSRGRTENSASMLRASVNGPARLPVVEPTVPQATLIRRDPSTGVQWNVAKLIDPPALKVSSVSVGTSESTGPTGAPIYLEIYTPGYRKFVSEHIPSRRYESYSSDSGSSGTAPSLIDSLSATESSAPSNASGIFRRRMWMEGSHFLGGRHRKRYSDDLDRSEEPMRSNSDLVDAGDESFARLSSGHSPVPSDGRLTAKGPKRSSIKGYTFLSPWQGRCEFVPSNLGNSLKCLHRLPDSKLPATVSELRFNLPSRSNHRKAASHSSTAEVSLALKPPRHTRNAHSISSIEPVPGRLDLSLGQELAGGGATGKQSKLGKLILEEEGVKMLDLVVASNMSLWWRAYGRTVSYGE